MRPVAWQHGPLREIQMVAVVVAAVVAASLPTVNTGASGLSASAASIVSDKLQVQPKKAMTLQLTMARESSVSIVI